MKLPKEYKLDTILSHKLKQMLTIQALCKITLRMITFNKVIKSIYKIKSH